VLTAFSQSILVHEKTMVLGVVIGSRLGALQCCFCLSYTCARESTNVLCLTLTYSPTGVMFCRHPCVCSGYDQEPLFRRGGCCVKHSGVILFRKG
jgi:hypothetical protein